MHVLHWYARASVYQVFLTPSACCVRLSLRTWTVTHSPHSGSQGPGHCQERWRFQWSAQAQLVPSFSTCSFHPIGRSGGRTGRRCEDQASCYGSAWWRGQSRGAVCLYSDLGRSSSVNRADKLSETSCGSYINEYELQPYHLFKLCCLGVVGRGSQLISNPPVSMVPVLFLASKQPLGNGLQTNLVLKERDIRSTLIVIIPLSFGWHSTPVCRMFNSYKCHTAVWWVLTTLGLDMLVLFTCSAVERAVTFLLAHQLMCTFFRSSAPFCKQEFLDQACTSHLLIYTTSSE